MSSESQQLAIQTGSLIVALGFREELERELCSMMKQLWRIRRITPNGEFSNSTDLQNIVSSQFSNTIFLAAAAAAC